MRKITKVPNGPLVKKKGAYAGSTLKKGGVIKKAQNGISKKGSKDTVETKIGNQTYVTTAPKNKGPKFVTNPMGASKDTSKYQVPRGIMNLVNEASKGYKAGGTIKKAQAGVKLTPQQKRAKLDSIASVRRADIIRKKDSILNRNAAARGMTREEIRAQQEKDKNKPNVPLEGLNIKAACKRGESKGSCATGETNKGESLKDTKRNGGPIKKAQNGTSQYSDPKPFFDRIKKSKDSIDNAMFKLKEKKFKSDMNYLNSKLKNEQSMMNTKKVKKAKAGVMIKRADGSYSRRGLWDNIRANRGSGKKPTKQMLQQERKIKAKTKK